MTDTLKVKQERYGKTSALQHWEALEDHQPIAVTPISAKHRGSTFAQDAIRITGSKQFIDSVLSNLKGFLDHENDSSRLEIMYTETLDTDRDRETGAITVKGLSGSWGCYLKVKDRGRGIGKRGPGKKNINHDATELERHLPSDGEEDDANETFPESPTTEPGPLVEIPVSKIDPHAVNAGLAIREKLRAANKKNQPIGSEDDPKFAVGTPDDEQENGYAWAEPEDGDMPMQIYDDLVSCGDRIKGLKKISAFKKADLQVVYVWKDKKGVIHCNS